MVCVTQQTDEPAGPRCPSGCGLGSIAARLMAGSVALAVFALTSASGQSAISFASGVTAPQGGAVLNGTAVNPTTGQSVRHLWSADAVNGLCRLDPDIDSAGPHSINRATCVTSVLGVALNAGELACDASSNTLYTYDASGKNAGIFRLHFVASGDSGQGLVDKVRQEIVGANCNVGLNQPTSAALGPDGNLYLGFKRRETRASVRVQLREESMNRTSPWKPESAPRKITSAAFLALEPGCYRISPGSSPSRAALEDAAGFGARREL